MSNDPVKQRGYQRKWMETNRAEYNRRRRAAYAADPSKRKAEASLREKLRRAGGDRDTFLMLTPDPCSYCGGPSGTIDHIDAITNGGCSTWENLTAACHYCNSSKSSAKLLAFLLRRR